MNQRILQAIAVLLACWGAHAQVNSGSNGSDGAFNPTTNFVINMADHPTGIYQYTSVNISNGVTVTFIPNANNTPVVWLVQSNVSINGVVDVSANPTWSGNWNQGPITLQNGGPGGYRGGNAGTVPSPGLGPGGGAIGGPMGGNASFASAGGVYVYTNSNYQFGFTQGASGQTYGNIFLVPLVGGSGGGGSPGGFGGGGGGAILIVASGTITVNGSILARGSAGGYVGLCYITQVPQGGGGAGSGGAIRLVASNLMGTGIVDASAYGPYAYDCWITSYFINRAGAGRIRFDTVDSTFSGNVNGSFTQGFQPIIIPTGGQGAQLTVATVGGVAVSASPSGQLATPDAVLSAQQNNPIPIVVHCSNIPLNTQITVTVRPANGAAVSSTGLNSGTLSSSTATVLINMPRGGGVIYATAAN